MLTSSSLSSRPFYLSFNNVLGNSSYARCKQSTEPSFVFLCVGYFFFPDSMQYFIFHTIGAIEPILLQHQISRTSAYFWPIFPTCPSFSARKIYLTERILPVVVVSLKIFCPLSQKRCQVQYTARVSGMFHVLKTQISYILLNHLVPILTYCDSITHTNVLMFLTLPSILRIALDP
jgi:hypothetical protein